MTYHNAIKFIKNAPNVTPKEESTSERILMLCNALGNPQKKIKYIRLAGSNGKTVCARMIISILNKAQILCGCLSMPIYSEIRENVRIGGEPISMDETVEYVSAVKDAVAQINLAKDEGDKVLFCPTAHEILLCVALLAFCAHKCNICIIESDHNGEDPSRFLPAPFAAVICGSIPNENRDRQDIYKIRSYICRGVREIISAPQNTEAYKIIADTCSAVNCRLTIAAKNKIEINRLTLRGTDFSYKGSEYSLRICGKFQTVNALVAIESAEMLVRLGYAISKEQICEGLAEVSAPCKFEILSISPTIIADSTHTPIAIEAVCDSLADFKDITGTKIKLCLPDGELIPYYIEALTRRGYEISAISALAIESIGEVERGNPNIPLVLSKTIKATAKSALLELDHDTTLLISGPSNFTRALRYELLCILGF
jgi:dihydrofolate synthase/folylpolyglutamate synthase